MELRWVDDSFVKTQAGLNCKGQILQGLRSRSLEAFKAQGFPSNSLEEWRYTDVRYLAEQVFQDVAGFSIEKCKAALEQTIPANLRGNVLVFANGNFVSELSQVQEVRGLTAKNIKSILGESDPVSQNIQQALGKYIDLSKQPFAALNTALFNDGICIHLSKNIKLEQPLVLFSYSETEGRSCICPRLVLIAEEGAEASIIDCHTGTGSYLVAHACEVVAGANSKIEHIKVQLDSPNAEHFGVIKSRLERDAIFSQYTISLGGRLCRNDLTSELAGSGCHAKLYGLTSLTADQHVDNCTVLHHQQPHCESLELYKGVYGGKSKGIFNGTIIVDPGAQKTNAIQSNKALLLSPTATSNAKPQLKIWADDVKCTHGATVGQIDEDGLFYLKSRGIPDKTARALLIQAFAADVLKELYNPEIRQWLEALSMAKLEQVI